MLPDLLPPFSPASSSSSFASSPTSRNSVLERRTSIKTGTSHDPAVAEWGSNRRGRALPPRKGADAPPAATPAPSSPSGRAASAEATPDEAASESDATAGLPGMGPKPKQTRDHACAVNLASGRGAHVAGALDVDGASVVKIDDTRWRRRFRVVVSGAEIADATSSHTRCAAAIRMASGESTRNCAVVGRVEDARTKVMRGCVTDHGRSERECSSWPDEEDRSAAVSSEARRTRDMGKH